MKDIWQYLRTSPFEAIMDPGSIAGLSTSAPSVVCQSQEPTFTQKSYAEIGLALCLNRVLEKHGGMIW